jgi:hypothetical protein
MPIVTGGRHYKGGSRPVARDKNSAINQVFQQLTAVWLIIGDAEAAALNNGL